MKVYRPAEALRPYVRYYWALEEKENFSVLTFPIGCPQMIFHRKVPLYIPELMVSQPQFTLSGQVNFPAHIRSNGNLDMIVIVFHPHTMGLFTGLSPKDFYNQEISGYSIGNNAIRELADKVFDCINCDLAVNMIEQWLIARIRKSVKFERIGAAVRKLLSCPGSKVSSVAKTACLSEKQFQRSFNECVGMNPKEYIRICRFQFAMKMLQIGSRDYVGIAYRSGYADQSHFIREFKSFSGLTPIQLINYQNPYSDLYTSPLQ